jgi:hypothetical protein
MGGVCFYFKSWRGQRHSLDDADFLKWKQRRRDRSTHEPIVWIYYGLGKAERTTTEAYQYLSRVFDLNFSE